MIIKTSVFAGPNVSRRAASIGADHKAEDAEGLDRRAAHDQQTLRYNIVSPFRGAIKAHRRGQERSSFSWPPGRLHWIPKVF